MRMISKIHDYYDGVARNTISDKTFTFVRKTKDLGEIKCDLLSLTSYETKDKTITIEGEVVGFCGVIYPCIRVGVTPKFGPYPRTEYAFYMYEWDEAEIFIPWKEIRIPAHRFYSSPKDEIKSWLEKGYGSRSWFQDEVMGVRDNPKLKSIFHDHKIAYFRIMRECREIKLISYPILTKLSFYKVFDCYTGFQALEYYLTNELVKPDEIDFEPSDELKAQAHGFDKWSFRKEPTKNERTKKTSSS